MNLVAVVLLADIFDFVDGVEFDLADALFVVHLDLVNFCVALVDFVALEVHLGCVFALHGLHLLLVLAALHVHLFVEVLLVLVLLGLKRLELGSIFQHKRTVLIALLLQFKGLSVQQFLALVGVVGFCLFLVLFQRSNFLLCRSFVLFDIVL